MGTASLIAARSSAIAGTVLAGLPLVAPIALAIPMAIMVGGIHFDYLIPAELFLLVLVGDVLLVIAAVLLRRHIVLVSVPAALTVIMFAATTWIAEATGLASGRTPASGWPFALVMTAYGLYVAAVIAVVVAGILLCRSAFARTRLRIHDPAQATR